MPAERFAGWSPTLRRTWSTALSATAMTARAFLHQLARGDLLDAYGSTDLVQIAPALRRSGQQVGGSVKNDDADLIAPLPTLSDGLALFAIRVMPRERVGSLEPLNSAHTPDVASGRQACRLVERCDRDVNIDGAVVSNDELRAASRAKLSLRPCRGPVDPGLTCDVGEGRGRDVDPSQHWRACRALAHPAMAIARLGGLRSSCPVAHRTAETASVENQFIGHGSCSFEDQHNDSRAKRITRSCPSQCCNLSYSASSPAAFRWCRGCDARSLHPLRRQPRGGYQ